MQRILTFYQQKISVFVKFMFEICNESLTNDVINFEQLGPGLEVSIESKYQGPVVQN